MCVSDYYKHRIQMFDINGQCINSASHLFVTDCNNDTIVEFDEKMKFVEAFGLKGNGNGQFQYACGIIIGAKFNIVVIDYRNQGIQILSEDGHWNKTIGKQESGDAEFYNPYNVIVYKTRSKIYVSDEDNHLIQGLSSDGKFLIKFGSSSSQIIVSEGKSGNNRAQTSNQFQLFYL